MKNIKMDSQFCALEGTCLSANISTSEEEEDGKENCDVEGSAAMEDKVEDVEVLHCTKMRTVQGNVRRSPWTKKRGIRGGGGSRDHKQPKRSGKNDEERTEESTAADDVHTVEYKMYLIKKGT